MELSNPRLKKFLGGNFPILKNKKIFKNKKKKKKEKINSEKIYYIFSKYSFPYISGRCYSHILGNGNFQSLRL